MPEPVTLSGVARLAAQLPAAEQKQLAESILRGLDAVDPATVSRLADTTWTAPELQQWPRAVQDAVLRQQVDRLIAHYQRDPRLADGVAWWTPSEIGRLPIDQRDILLEASAMVAAEEYRTNPDLTAFEAFGEDDLHGDSASSEPFPGSHPPADAR